MEPTQSDTQIKFELCSENEDDSNDESSGRCDEISDSLKLRLYSMCKFLLDYETEDGRKPMLQFMEEPSRKFYPEHYETNNEPVDMLVIESNIRANKYSSEAEFLTDIRRMFHDCRESNEVESSIYQDALTLENVLMSHVRETREIVEDERPAIVNFIKVEIPDLESGIPCIKTEIVDIPDVKMEVSSIGDIKMKVSNVIVEEDPIALPTTPNITVTTSTSTSRKRAPKLNKYKKVSGYILYSCSARKVVRANNPQFTFGEVSAIVGSEWKKLSDHEKNEWELKAAKINKESYDNTMLYQNTISNSPVSVDDRKPGAPAVRVPKVKGSTVRVWECLWDNCNCMFEDLYDCLEHALANQTGHVSSWFVNDRRGQYQCQWKNCLRVKNNMVPFPNLHRLVRHVREVHILKNMGLQRQNS